MQKKAGIALMPVWENVVDPRRVKTARPALNAVHDVPFVEQEFGQIGTVLPCDAGDQSCFSHFFRPWKRGHPALGAASRDGYAMAKLLRRYPLPLFPDNFRARKKNTRRIQTNIANGALD